MAEELKTSLDIIEQYKNLVKTLNSSIENEEQKRYFYKIGFLLVRAVKELQITHNSLAEQKRAGKFKDSTTRDNLAFLRQSIIDLREICTLNGIGDCIPVLNTHYFPDEMKQTYLKFEQNRKKVQKGVKKEDIKVIKGINKALVG